MTHLKKISTTLTIASAILLEACSSGGGNDTSSGPDPIANTKAPLLIASWSTACVTTAAGTSTSTGASGGGSGGGSGGITGGEAFIDTVTFNQNGRVQFTTESFATSNCNTNTSSGINSFAGVYFIGEADLANDGSAVTHIDYNDASSTTYSIFQIVNDSSLFLGNDESSTNGNDGSSSSTRLDGLGSQYIKN